MPVNLKHVRYTNLPDRRNVRLIRDLEWPQAIWFAAWVIPGLALFVIQALFPALLFVFIGTIGAWPFTWGYGLTYPKDWRAGWKIKRHNGDIYKGADGSKLNSPVIDLELSQFWDILGTTWNPRTDADTIGIRVSGWLHANDELLDRYHAERRVEAVIKTVIAQVDTDIEYSMINGQRPFEPTDWAADVEQNFLHDEVLAHAEGDVVSQRLFNNVNQAFMTTALQGASYVGCFTLTVKRPKEWKNIARRPQDFTQKQLFASPLMRALTAMTEGLTSVGFRDVEYFDIDQLNEFVFKSWNVRYLKQLLDGENTGYHKGLSPWPQLGIRVLKDVLITDGSYHRVHMVTAFGINKVLPGGMHRLLTGHLPWVVVSLCSNTVSKSMEHWFLVKKRDVRNSFMKEHYKGGMIVDREERDRRQADVDKVDSLYLSGSKPLRFNVYIVVSGESEEAVNVSEEALMAKLRELRIRTIPVKGRARILRAFLAATLGLRV